MVFWNKALLFWRSGRQGFPTLSTAEAELVETIKGITLGDSVEALLKEHEPWSYRKEPVHGQPGDGCALGGHGHWLEDAAFAASSGTPEVGDL